MERKEIIERMKKATNELWQLEKMIEKENQQGQFDFCTCAELGVACGNLEAEVKRIVKIVFQEG